MKHIRNLVFVILSLCLPAISAFAQFTSCESGSNTCFNSGNVGIGTTSPSASLEVNGLMKSTTRKEYLNRIPHANARAGDRVKYVFSNYFVGKITIFAARITDQNIGVMYEADIVFDGNKKSATDYAPQFQFLSVKQNKPSNGIKICIFLKDNTGVDKNSVMTVVFGQAGNSYTFRVVFEGAFPDPIHQYDNVAPEGILMSPKYVLKNGVVGIGIAGPSHKLDVAGNVGVGKSLYLKNQARTWVLHSDNAPDEFRITSNGTTRNPVLTIKGSVTINALIAGIFSSESIASVP